MVGLHLLAHNGIVMGALPEAIHSLAFRDLALGTSLVALTDLFVHVCRAVGLGRWGPTGCRPCAWAPRSSRCLIRYMCISVRPCGMACMTFSVVLKSVSKGRTPDTPS